MNTVYLDRRDSFFKEKASSHAFFVEKNLNGNIYVDDSGSEIPEHFYLYEINIKVDLRLIGRTNVDKVTVTLKGDGEVYEGTPFINYGSLYANGLTATSTVLNSDTANLAHLVMTNTLQRINNLTEIDALQFIDINRYKNNFRGSYSDKYGVIREMKTSLSKIPDEALLESASDTEQFAVAEKTRNDVEKALFSGKSVIDVLNLKSLKSSQAETRHVITTQEQEEKEIMGPDIPITIENPVNGEVIPAADTALAILNETPPTQIPHSQITYSDSPMRRVSFLLKIKDSDLTKSLIATDKFFVVLTAKTINGIIVDDMSIPIDLEKDLLMDAITLGNLLVTGENEKDKFIVNIENNAPVNSEVLLHCKKMKKDIPFYKNRFYESGLINMDANQKNAKFTIPKGARTTGDPSTANIPFVGTADIPRFYRITPKLGGLSFDNVYEIAQPPKNPYRNSHVPFMVTNHMMGGRMYNKISVDTGFIPMKYRKIKVLKRDLQRYVYSGVKNLKKIKNKNFEEENIIDITNVRNLHTDIVSIKDYDVREDAFYDYRLELVDDVGRVEKIYSSTFFQEKITKGSKKVSISCEAERSSTGEFVSIAANVRVVESSARAVFEQLHRDIYDLFQSEIDEIRDDVANTIIIGVERIDLEDSSISFIGYHRDPNSSYQQNPRTSSNTNIANISFMDSVPNKNSNYVYKLTSYVKPVIQAIAAINDELDARATVGSGGSFDLSDTALVGELYADIRRKIKKIETSVLNSISNKYSSKEARLGLIVDPETRRVMNKIDKYGSASTGNIAYATAYVSMADSSEYLDDINIAVHQSRDKNNRDPKVGVGNTKSKFMITFKAKFSKSTDHCAVFLSTGGSLDFCCNMHVNHDKEDYRVLVEKNNLRGNVAFFLYPIDMLGTVLNRQELGSITLRR